MREAQIEVAEFRQKVWSYYKTDGRDLPWRSHISPYGVYVSEVMLQQTQVSRVVEKWLAWMRRFPNFESLAKADLSEVLKSWDGLGYNRRALWLRLSAEMIVNEFESVLPHEVSQLERLKGIGKNTAGSIAAFAYDLPSVFIETNIRRAFISEYFAEEEQVSDGQLLPLIQEAVSGVEHPREWYWAVMDYGAQLAKTGPNPNRRSSSYHVQAPFVGSLRQLRGEVLRRVANGSLDGIMSDDRLDGVLAALASEGFIQLVHGRWELCA